MSEQIEIAKYDQQYDDLKTSSPKTFAQNAVMTTNEVALFLDCSKQYIALLASTGKLSYLRNTDNGYLFYKYDIIEYKKTKYKKRKINYTEYANLENAQEKDLYTLLTYNEIEGKRK